MFDPKTLVKIVTRIYAFYIVNNVDARPSSIPQGNDFFICYEIRVAHNDNAR